MTSRRLSSAGRYLRPGVETASVSRMDIDIGRDDPEEQRGADLFRELVGATFAARDDDEIREVVGETFTAAADSSTDEVRMLIHAIMYARTVFLLALARWAGSTQPTEEAALEWAQDYWRQLSAEPYPPY